jgi:hypothetical protein
MYDRPMLRAFYAFLIVAGVALGVFSAIRAVTDHGPALRPTVVVAPSTLSRTLTPGAWSVYTQTGTGQYGTVLPIGTTVTAPGGSHVPVTLASGVGTLRAGGKKFVQYDNVVIPAAGTYQVAVTAPSSVEVVLAPAPRTTLPWVALTIDGAVLLLVGWILTAVDARHRRQVRALEATYVSVG